MKFLEKLLSLGLYLLAFLLPWQTRLFIRPGVLNGGYWEYGTISLYGTDVLLISLLVIYLISKFSIFNPPAGEAGFQFFPRTGPRSAVANNFQFFPQKRDSVKAVAIFKQNKILIWLIVGLNLVSLISIFFAADKTLAFFVWARLTLGMGLFFLVCAAMYNRAKLMYAFLAGAAIQAGLGSWQFLTQTTFASKWLGLAAHPAEVGGNSVIETVAGGRWLRAYGGLDHPNMLGGLLAISLLLILGLIIKNVADLNTMNSESRIENKEFFSNGAQFTILYSAFFILLTGLFFTFSRGAWTGLAVGLIVFFVQSPVARERQALRKFFILGAAAAVLVGVLFFTYSDLVTTRLTGTARLEIKSNRERAASYHDAITIIKNNLFTGTGIGGYTGALVKLYPNEPSWFYQPAHNTFLLVWSEVGLIGLLLYLGIIGMLIITNFEFRIFNKFKIFEFRNKLDINNSKFNQNSKLIIQNLGNESTEILNYSGQKFLSLALLLAVSVMMLVDHYFWSLHFGILFFWFLLGLAAKNEFTADLTRVA